MKLIRTWILGLLAGFAGVLAIIDERIIRLYQPDPRRPSVSAGSTRWAKVP